MYILGLDTTQNIGRIELVEIETSRFYQRELDGKKLSETLIVEISKLLSDLSIKLENISSIVANLGPGSFTGLRIGIASALGLAKALQINMLCVTQFEIMLERYKSKWSGKLVLVGIDLRKKGICAQTYEVGKIIKPFDSLKLYSKQDFLLESMKADHILTDFECKRKNVTMYASDNSLKYIMQSYKNNNFKKESKYSPIYI